MHIESRVWHFSIHLKKRSPRPMVFDRNTRVLKLKNQLISFGEIYAVQVIKEYCRGSEGPGYWSYELNLVKPSGERMHLVDHANGKQILENALLISQMVQCKFWDGTSTEPNHSESSHVHPVGLPRRL
jgi:hypothetical protein